MNEALEKLNRVQEKSQDAKGYYRVRANYIMNSMLQAQKHIYIETLTK